MGKKEGNLSKKIKAFGIILVCLILIGGAAFWCVKHFKKDKSIVSDEILLYVYPDKLDAEKAFAKPRSNRNENFDYSDTTNIGKAYLAYMTVKLGKGFEGKIEKVDANINYTKEAMNYLIDKESYEDCDPFSNSEGGEGVITLFFDGVTRQLSNEELINILKKCSVDVKITYKSRKVKTKTVDFKDTKYSIKEENIPKENPLIVNK